VLDKKYQLTKEKINLDEEDGTFLMCFNDFRKIFSKIYICIDFPPSIVGFRITDCWSASESGGLPINNTQEEFISWAKNPQYYLKLTKDSTVFISLLQKDGRMTKNRFPYAEYTNKACIVIASVNGKQKINRFDEINAIEITPIRQHRENSVYKDLPKGEYIIIPSIMQKGKTGEFALELYFPDVLKNIKTEDDRELLTYTKIEKLGSNFKSCRLIDDERADSIHQVNEMKKIFIYSHFQSILKDDDDNEYNSKGKNGNKNNPNNRKTKAVGNSKKKNENEEYY
jgi:hypothetical protein